MKTMRNTISFASNPKCVISILRSMLFIVIGIQLLLIIPDTSAGMAPSNKPKLPDGFCRKETGVITDTTGECMCNWQHKNGCKGSACQYEYGLSWYHYSCKDCECVSEPTTNAR
mmetsp:Transcript_3820/g.5201  ORF Transcript_3820/g.5201 Transcript_3820/m.5201 type:complete len:114 (+) Transcript_3820:151-492(+)